MIAITMKFRMTHDSQIPGGASQSAVPRHAGYLVNPVIRASSDQSATKADELAPLSAKDVSRLRPIDGDDVSALPRTAPLIVLRAVALATAITIAAYLALSALLTPITIYRLVFEQGPR